MYKEGIPVAMFECPGCKHIVDDSIKKCPNCDYDIRKYIKSKMKEAKKTGKSFGGDTIALSSVYSPGQTVSKELPTLDFLSEKPVLESPSLRESINSKADENTAAAEPAGVSEPAPIGTPEVKPAASSFTAPEVKPAVNSFTAPEVKPAVNDFSASEMKINEITPERVPEPKVENVSIASAESTVFSAAPTGGSAFSGITSAADSEPIITVSNDKVKKPVSSNPGFQTSPAQKAVAEQNFGFSPVMPPSRSTLPDSAIKISAPSVPAPERKPIEPNKSIVPPKPVYADKKLQVNEASVNEQKKPMETIKFDSPSLNAATIASNHIPASQASISINKPAPVSQPVPQVTSAKAAEKKEENVSGFVFDSPALNKRAAEIASGQYVPTSKASEATMADLNKPKNTNGQISHNSFGQMQQQSSYRDYSNTQNGLYGSVLQKPQISGYKMDVTGTVNNSPAYQSPNASAVNSANPLLAAGTGTVAPPPNPLSANNAMLSNMSVGANNPLLGSGSSSGPGAINPLLGASNPFLGTPGNNN